MMDSVGEEVGVDEDLVGWLEGAVGLSVDMGEGEGGEVGALTCCAGRTSRRGLEDCGGVSESSRGWTRSHVHFSN